MPSPRRPADALLGRQPIEIPPASEGGAAVQCRAGDGVGELDRRVPIANGYELRQGLEDVGVPTDMVVYAGYGHGITKPKSVQVRMIRGGGMLL